MARNPSPAVSISAPESGEFVSDDKVVSLEQLLPGRVAQAAHTFCRSDDIGENNSGQHAIVMGRRPDSGEELLYLINDHIPVADVRQVVGARKCD